MDDKKKNIILAIVVILFGLSIVGGTFAYLTLSIEVTNNTYTGSTDCFIIDYNINNNDNTQDITGILFPSLNASGGLSGRVGLKRNSSCQVNGRGTLIMKIISDNTTASLTSNASSYCRSRKTGEAVNLDETACTNAGHRWISIPTSYCENNSTLELTSSETQSTCTSNNGTWVTNGSPLKWAVYNNSTATGTPLNVGHILASDIGSANGITVLDDFPIYSTQDYYYIYIWMDGNLTDNSYQDVHFAGHLEASAIQDLTLEEDT